jgi:hypothetical protein
MECYQKLCDTLGNIAPEQGNCNGYDRDAALTITQDARMRFKAWVCIIVKTHRRRRTQAEFKILGGQYSCSS